MVDVTGIFGNIGLQLFILLLLTFSFYQAHSKKQKHHCSLMRAALLLQFLSIVFVMFPSFSYFSGMPLSDQFLFGLWVHHIAGLLVVLLVIYINLAVRGSVRFLGEPYRLMKPTLLLWILVLLGGAFIYLGLYPPI